MTHHEFDHILGSVDALSPEQVIRLRGELDRRLSGPETSPPGEDQVIESPPKPIWEEILDLTADVPDGEWDKLPVDLAEQHDHYIYGTPKRPIL